MKKPKSNIANPMQCIFSRTVAVTEVQQNLIGTIAELANGAPSIQCHVHTDKVDTVYVFVANDVCATLYLQPLIQKGGAL